MRIAVSPQVAKTEQICCSEQNFNIALKLFYVFYKILFRTPSTDFR